VRLISDNDGKDDPVDAELLARLGRVDVRLLSPIEHRGEGAQADLAVIRARDALVAARTQLVNHVRGAVKSLGSRLEKSSARSFADKRGDQVPEALRRRAGVGVIAEITNQIGGYDRRSDAAARRSIRRPS
jgi:transposase